MWVVKNKLFHFGVIKLVKLTLKIIPRPRFNNFAKRKKGKAGPGPDQGHFSFERDCGNHNSYNTLCLSKLRLHGISYYASRYHWCNVVIPPLTVSQLSCVRIQHWIFILWKSLSKSRLRYYFIQLGYYVRP